jgi:hypothetical protein
MRFIFIVTLFFLTTLFAFFPTKSFAIEDPLRVPNNKIGIHILFPYELEEAAKLVNSNGGDYGYVTIPIQSNDKDIEKWQEFLDNAKRLHIIPIIRLATEPDPHNTHLWRKPNDYDTIDFANFLNSLNWPYKNRYIIVYNEVNRGDEWGGSLNPTEYAEILSYAVTVFKSKHSDFFIISAGLDNAAPNKGTEYMNQYIYLRNMNNAVPGIFNQIDGLSSHSYPNPGFAQHPATNTSMSINSFQYELALVKSMSPKDLPVFITETGWATDAVSDKLAASYYTEALSSVWADRKIVAITPFILQGRGSPFQKFSLFGENNTLTAQYTAIKNFPKTKGLPMFSNVLAASTIRKSPLSPVEKNFSDHQVTLREASPSPLLKEIFKWLLKIQ